MDEDWDEEKPDGDKPDDEEPESSVDDALEAARRGEYVTAPTTVGPVIGSQRIVQADVVSTSVRPLWRCSCGQLAYAGEEGRHGRDWHLVEPVEEVVGVGDEYYDQVAAAVHERRLDKWLEWGPNEWRAIPEFANYEMNGFTREVRRPARVQILRNGRPRSYPAFEIKARKSSVTLSNDNGAKSHGIEKLWRLTFPEYVSDPNSWNMHSLRRDDNPEGFERVVKSRR